jgi:putative tricarboxylic transport membrane protein
MDVLNYLLYGFSIALQPENLLFCFVGCLIGTLVGVLPGIGPMGAISILLPITFRMSSVSAIIMLGGIFYGVMYGGSTTSILVNIPGEATSIITCLDGNEMAKQGRAGPALGIAAFGSFIAGTLGVIGLMLFASPLAEFGLRFGPAEYAALIILGLTLITYLTHGPVIKALIMGAIGLVLSCVGLDQLQGSVRLTFDVLQLMDGFDLVPLAMGLFGIAEMLENVEQTMSKNNLKGKLKNLYPSRLDWIQSKGAILRGTVIGFFLGILPGAGATISSFVSYTVEKRIAKEPSRFGKGAIEGVAGPESANNAAASGAFVPLLTLGIPANIAMALFFGALLIHGVRPGPLLITDHPDIFWGFISSMYIGNGMLLILNLPLIPMWVQILKIPNRILYPLILLFCIIGAYSIKNSAFDIALMLIFGVIGYLFKKCEYAPAPLLLAFVLGPMLEFNLRQALMVSKGDLLFLFRQPISAVIISIAIILLIAPPILHLAKRKMATSRTDA